MNFITSPRTRLYLYTVSSALLIVLAAYGALDGEKIAVLNAFLGALFGVAAANTPSTYVGKHEV